jgi:hypothetical protein
MKLAFSKPRSRIEGFVSFKIGLYDFPYYSINTEFFMLRGRTKTKKNYEVPKIVTTSDNFQIKTKESTPNNFNPKKKRSLYDTFTYLSKTVLNIVVKMKNKGYQLYIKNDNKYYSFHKDYRKNSDYTVYRCKNYKKTPSKTWKCLYRIIERRVDGYCCILGPHDDQCEACILQITQSASDNNVNKRKMQYDSDEKNEPLKKKRKTNMFNGYTMQPPTMNVNIFFDICGIAPDKGKVNSVNIFQLFCKLYRMVGNQRFPVKINSIPMIYVVLFGDKICKIISVRNYYELKEDVEYKFPESDYIITAYAPVENKPKKVDAKIKYISTTKVKKEAYSYI